MEYYDQLRVLTEDVDQVIDDLPTVLRDHIAVSIAEIEDIPQTFEQAVQGREILDTEHR